MRDKGGLNLFSYICKRNKANFMNIKRPLILVSNDDGYHAKGINCLVDMLRDMADIVVCAPESARSGFATYSFSHNLSISSSYLDSILETYP